MSDAIAYKGAVYQATGSVKDFVVDEAQELLDGIRENLQKLDKMFRRVGGVTYTRWKSYPYGNIRCMLDDDHDYGKQSSTIDELIKDVEDEQKGVSDDEKEERE